MARQTSKIVAVHDKKQEVISVDGTWEVVHNTGKPTDNLILTNLVNGCSQSDLRLFAKEHGAIDAPFPPINAGDGVVLLSKDINGNIIAGLITRIM